MPGNVHSNPYIIHPSDELAKNIDLRNLTRSLAIKYADGHVVTDDDLQIMGRMLWNALGVQDEFDAAVKAAGDAILSIIIESDRPEVQAFPWETLYHPTHGFIGRNSAFTLTRRIAEGKSSQATLEKGPLRVLLFTSLPDNVDAELGRLNVEEEQDQVQEALLEWIRAGVVQLEMPDDGRFSTLKELLESFKPHVLFLSGHGKFHHEPHADEAYGEFLFESDTEAGEAIRDEEIARALSKTHVRVVILSACESGKAASDSLSNGLMQQISDQGIPHVIGMRESVLDVAGIQFARTLCDALAGQKRLDVALQSARVEIQKAMDERGQWCLPMALSPNPQLPLIDWEFEPQAIQPQRINQRLNNVSLPAQFVGRRAERRKVQDRLTQGTLRRLLITGAGGQGKTALAGKLALDMQAHGWKVFAWNADAEKSWSGFELEELFNSLNTFRQDRLKEAAGKQPVEMERAKSVLKELSEQFDGKVTLFLDNLETLQDADTFEIKDETVAAWLGAAGGMEGVTVLATSRWEIPHWMGEILAGLAGVKYGDFLQIAISKTLYINRDQMRRVYDELGGNIRGLEFFDVALKELPVHEAYELLEKLEGIEAPLAEAKQKLQANMAIAEIYSRLPDDAKKLLARLPVYHELVPIEGLLRLGIDFPDAENLLELLLAVSLLEASDNPRWNVMEYQVSPMVTDWMNEKGLIDNSPEWLNVVADYHLYLHENKRRTLEQAITTHHALRRSERHDEANHLTLNSIIGPMTRAGLYSNLLDDWLPQICNSKNLKIRADALGRMGKLYLHIGSYSEALPFLEQSLNIFQQISDKDGEGTALNSISQVFKEQGDYTKALTYLEQALAICQQLGNKKDEGTTLSNIAAIYRRQGDYDTALTHIKKALAIQLQIGDKAGISVTFNNIAQISQSQGDIKSALVYLKESLEIMRQVGDKAGEGVTLNNIATIYNTQGDYTTALGYFKKSLAILKEIGNKAEEGTTLNNIAMIYSEQGDHVTALAYLEQAMEVCRQIGDKSGEGIRLNNIAITYNSKGDYQNALVYFEKSLAIHQQIGNKEEEGIALNNISAIHYSKKNYKIALIYYKQALELQQRLNNKAGEGVTLSNISQIYVAQGDYATALDYLEQSLEITQRIGDKAAEGTTLNNISQIYHTQGNTKMALSYLEKSIEIVQKTGNQAGLCGALFNIGHIYFQDHQVEKARDAWVSSYVIASQINYAQVLQALSQLALELGRSEGLDVWRQLAQHKQEITENENEVSELEGLRRFVADLVEAVSERNPEAEKFFRAVSIMAMDTDVPLGYQELGKVLKNYMLGSKKLDISSLPDEFRKIIEEELLNK
ncbi:MAG: tetratricopeptide repeat protein [Anaerolineales bacterium]|nr:tetratricopeptide repeat protein [Anaerolineales bacterium]